MKKLTEKNWILFNPVSITHYRNIKLFEGRLGKFNIRCILNPRSPWFSKRDNVEYDHFYFSNDRIPARAFDGVKAIVLFSAQPRLPSTYLIQEAASCRIPVIAIQEVYQMILEQGFVNEYFLPVDHLFVCSEYERERFLEFGVPSDVAETTGCIFHSNSPQPKELAKDSDLVKRLGLSKNKRIATLSLACQTPSGETLEIRKQLLLMVSQGLPERYQLVIKPHPAEQDKDIDNFVKKYAPDAKIVDQSTPIGDVLRVTDVLFNRGNSQVVVNALENQVPVIVVPTGRTTIFHGLLDEVIVNNGQEITRAIELVEKQGMSIYDVIFKKFLSITAAKAIESVIGKIDMIAETGNVYNPTQRLQEIALFWAWMGYTTQAFKTLSETNNLTDKENLLSKKISSLITCEASRDDLIYLTQWANRGYREWLIKSLWVKSLYLGHKEITAYDKKWLADFPPRMNREYFIPYVSMLGWSYLRNGMRPECELLVERLYGEYSFLNDIRRLKELLKSHKRSYPRVEYWQTRLKYRAATMLKDFAWEFGSLGN